MGLATANCPIFLTAAYLVGLFSSPMWLILLPNQLGIDDLCKKNTVIKKITWHKCLIPQVNITQQLKKGLNY